MTKLERYDAIVMLHRSGATYEQLAGKFHITAQRVCQIVSAGPPEANRHRGRPCPNIIEGERCGGSSEVLRVWDETDAGVRIRACLTCGYRWETEERARSANKTTGSIEVQT